MQRMKKITTTTAAAATRDKRIVAPALEEQARDADLIFEFILTPMITAPIRASERLETTL